MAKVQVHGLVTQDVLETLLATPVHSCCGVPMDRNLGEAAVERRCLPVHSSGGDQFAQAVPCRSRPVRY